MKCIPVLLVSKWVSPHESHTSDWRGVGRTVFYYVVWCSNPFSYNVQVVSVPLRPYPWFTFLPLTPAVMSEGTWSLGEFLQLWSFSSSLEVCSVSTDDKKTQNCQTPFEVTCNCVKLFTWFFIYRFKKKCKTIFFFNLNYMGCTLRYYCLVCVSRVDI